MSVTNPSVRRSAFTIVELLVVVAILGVLMSLVLVGVSSMDDSAMSTTDLARQRQIALASGQYAARMMDGCFIRGRHPCRAEYLNRFQLTSTKCLVTPMNLKPM